MQHERGPINYLDGARRIAFILSRAYEEKGEKKPDDLDDQLAGLIGDDKGETGA